MPFNSEKRSKQATVRKRDSKGHFIPLNPHLKSSSGVSGSGKIISDFIRGEESKDDEALVNVKVLNPLKKITQLMQDIKNKQSTTVSMRFTIPLIALPVVALIAFGIGRYNASCINNQSSKTGVLKVINFNEEKLIIPFLPESLNFKQTISGQRPILVRQSGSILSLDGELGNLQPLYNNVVIATGDYSSCNESLSISSSSNIQKI